jgi:hypothetical protein
MHSFHLGMAPLWRLAMLLQLALLALSGAAAAPAGFVTRSGSALSPMFLLDGRPFHVVGANQCVPACARTTGVWCGTRETVLWDTARGAGYVGDLCLAPHRRARAHCAAPHLLRAAPHRPLSARCDAQWCWLRDHHTRAASRAAQRLWMGGPRGRARALCSDVRPHRSAPHAHPLPTAGTAL